MPPSRLDERDVRVVTNVRRDAVDADVGADERLTTRTAKSCGPDPPTLPDAGIKPARRRWQAMVANKPGAPGRARSSR
jgi:hypothetical protein